ncbi:hypothetical protein CPB83DRAFT_904320 [Crepidotus variabilis]|uniref:Uncharacterized protein n=1 Tax=Crepidotus variabilis TaxID=179855 RepID=A0A9P6EKW8_9AGAR|nr:hypothetical protein CPB83DRAFT_904320 [Crepidotus variabilis]
MLKKLFGHFGSHSHKPPELCAQVELEFDSLANPPFRHLKIFNDLQNIALLHSTLNQPSFSEANWQLPLPYDVVFAIIHIFLNDSKTLWNLYGSCASLHQLCGPLVHQTISIHTRSRAAPSTLEKFARSIAQNPQVIANLQTLRIIDDGKMFQGCRPITAEEVSLCFILTRNYPLLRRIELDLQVVWDIIPPPLQHAFHIAFALPTLREISTLEMCAEVSGPPQFVEFRQIQCSPEHLTVEDQRLDGISTFTNMFNELTSPLRLASLRILECRSYPQFIHLLNEPLERCSQTLISLTILIIGKCSSSYLVKLEPLTTLKMLTLSCDTKLTSLNNNPISLANFNFLVATISSSQKPSSIEDIYLLIRTHRFDFARRLPWNHLDDVFKRNKYHSEWPNLRKIWVKLIDEDLTQRDEGWYKQGRIEIDILPLLPNLASLELVQFEMVFGKHQFLSVQ